MRKIFGFTGPAGSGKDTAGAILIQNGFNRFAFADHLKATLAVLFEPMGLTLAHFNDRDLKETTIEIFGKSPRELMQSFGTDWARKLVHPDIWLMAAEGNLKKMSGRIVVTDIRFENEANLVRSLGGVIVHLGGRQPSTCSSTATHASEKPIAFAEGDVRLSNTGSIEDLHLNVLKLTNTL